jgi:hypothetical protein
MRRISRAHRPQSTKVFELGLQILNVKIVYALSKNLGFVIGFDSEAQSRV